MGDPEKLGTGGNGGGEGSPPEGEEPFEESTETLDRPPDSLDESVGRFGQFQGAKQPVQAPREPEHTGPSPTIEEILEIEGNRDSFDRLREALSTTSVVPFVGAGLSVPLDYPGWSNFLIKLATEHGVEEVVRERLDRDEYEGATEAILEKVGRTGFDFAIDANFGPAQMSPVLRGAVVQLPKLFQGPVITTNFDQVIERTYDEAGRPFEYVFIGFDAERAILKDMRNERYLLKIHGDVDLKKGRILTRESYEEHYGPGETVDRTKDLPQTLSRIAASHQLVFLGCSLAEDRTMHVLKELAPQTTHVPHFAIQEEPRDPEAKVAKFKFLAEHNIRAIWYPPDRHECVEAILEELSEDVGIPTRGRMLVPGIYLALLAALIASIFMSRSCSGSRYEGSICVGIVSPTDVSDNVVEKAFDRQIDVFNALQRAVSGRGAYVLEQKKRYNRDGMDKAIRDLQEGTIDALGVLSPYWVYRAVEEAGVEPVISPLYGGSSTYEAVVIVNNDWLQKLRRQGELTPAELRELSEVSAAEGKVDCRIRPALWKRLIKKVRNEDGVIAVMDATSTSGYWYPRKLIIDELAAEKGFGQVTTSPPGDEYEIVRKVAQGTEMAIAGAIARFRLETAPTGRDEEFDAYRKKVTVVHRMLTIPNGAFVVRPELARDRGLLKALRESWGEASRQTHETAKDVDLHVGDLTAQLAELRPSPTSDRDTKVTGVLQAYEKLKEVLPDSENRVRHCTTDDERPPEEEGKLSALMAKLRAGAPWTPIDVEDALADLPVDRASIKKCYPQEWSPVDRAHYLPAFDAFTIRDPAEAPKAARFTTFLMIGAGLVLVIALAFLIQRHRRVAPKESPE